jgi:hypothetical protein
LAETILSLTPFIIGSALVPLQIIITIVLLSNPKGGLIRAILLVMGMTVVRLLQGVVFGLLFSPASGNTSGKSPVVSTLLLILGILLLITAYKQWRQEDDPDAPPPKWLAMMDTLTPLKAFGLGAGITLISGKMWVFTLGAIGVIEYAQLGQPESTVTFLIFVALAQSLLLLAILIRILLPKRSASLLESISAWLNRYNRQIVLVVSLVFGLLFFYQGASGLSGAVAGRTATQTSQATTQDGDLPAVTEYNLGETTITQGMFPEDSRFHNMPVRLNGVIAVPAGNDGPYPVAVILHGNHPGCPIPEGDMVDRWPCDPSVERPNYRGFAYLVQQLADAGYVALSMNINAEYTFGFGEPYPVERLKQLVDLHLKALGEATNGGENAFGVDLAGRADLSRLAFIGHSQGGEGAYWLIQNEDLEQPQVAANLGYGPAYGLLMVAPSANLGGASPITVPLAIILPACDGDVINQEGQLFYEITRMEPAKPAWASSAWLESANHNYFNETLKDESLARPGRPDCEPLLVPEVQRDFLSAYAKDFLARIFAQESAAMENLGMDFQARASDELYDLPARVAALAPGAARLPLLMPAAGAELETNRLGGQVTAEGLTLTYCEEGYYVPAMVPGSEPCKRVNLVIPGNPAMIVAAWEQDDAALRFSVPPGNDLSQYAALSLRAALDPLSPLNEAGAYQAFSVQLVDRQGKTVTVRTRPEEPALRYPPGNEVENDSFDGGMFTGRVPLTSIRLPLSDFRGVDLDQVAEINLLFDQRPSGTLFISDLEFVK